MRAITDTEGMTTLEMAAFFLERLTKAAHRGRHDTWTAARDRAAEDAGIKPSVAKRIWQRLDTMDDVKGTPLLKLMLAYEGLCQSIEDAADAMRAERMKLKVEQDETARSRLGLATGKAVADAATAQGEQVKDVGAGASGEMGGARQ